MLVVMMLAAAYGAGWVSHRSWNRRNLIESMSSMIDTLDGPVRVDQLEGSDMLITRGRKEDVEKVNSIIAEARN